VSASLSNDASGPTVPISGANVPSGTPRDAEVAPSHRVVPVPRPAADSTSRASRVLPTPAGPGQHHPAGSADRRVGAFEFGGSAGERPLRAAHTPTIPPTSVNRKDLTDG
jgi:hypothetical protein